MFGRETLLAIAIRYLCHFCNWRNVITSSKCEPFHSVLIFVKYSPKIQNTFHRKIRLFIHKIFLLMFLDSLFGFILKCNSVESISQINFATTISILVLFTLLPEYYVQIFCKAEQPHNLFSCMQTRKFMLVQSDV